MPLYGWVCESGMVLQLIELGNDGFCAMPISLCEIFMECADYLLRKLIRKWFHAPKRGSLKGCNYYFVGMFFLWEPLHSATGWSICDTKQ